MELDGPTRKASAMVLAAAIFLTAGAYLVSLSPPTPAGSGGAALFAGAYWVQNQTLVIPAGNLSSGITNFSVGPASFSLAYSNWSGTNSVLGTVIDPSGLVFAPWIYASGPFNISNQSTTWGAPDGNEAVGVTDKNATAATIQLRTRVDPWLITFQSAPAPGPCGTTGSPLYFQGALWTAWIGDCGSPAGLSFEWNVTPESGTSFTFGYDDLEVSACQALISAHIVTPAATLGVQCSGWFDPDGLYGLSLSIEGPLILAMSAVSTEPVWV